MIMLSFDRADNKTTLCRLSFLKTQSLPSDKDDLFDIFEGDVLPKLKAFAETPQEFFSRLQSGPQIFFTTVGFAPDTQSASRVIEEMLNGTLKNEIINVVEMDTFDMTLMVYELCRRVLLLF